jgi:hypothetical protein
MDIPLSCVGVSDTFQTRSLGARRALAGTTGIRARYMRGYVCGYSYPVCRGHIPGGGMFSHVKILILIEQPTLSRPLELPYGGGH